MGLKEWFAHERSDCWMRVQPVTIEQASNVWHISADRTRLGSDTASYGAVFRSVDLGDGSTPYITLMLQPNSASSPDPHGLILLAKFRAQFLVQAKAEPGADGPVLTTTIQSSFRRLPEKPYAELAASPPVVSVVAVEDPGMLSGKRNEHRVVVLTKFPVVQHHFTLATVDEIRALAQEGLVSQHLLECLGALALSGKSIRY